MDRYTNNFKNKNIHINFIFTIIFFFNLETKTIEPLNFRIVISNITKTIIIRYSLFNSTQTTLEEFNLSMAILFKLN